MDKFIEDVLKAGINRNLICAKSKNNAAGFEEKLLDIMIKTMITNTEERVKLTHLYLNIGDLNNSDYIHNTCKDWKIVAVPFENYDVVSACYSSNNCMLPANKKYLCIGMDYELIFDNGIKEDYVILGAY